jgi:hypothetical protein
VCSRSSGDFVGLIHIRRIVRGIVGCGVGFFSLHLEDICCYGDFGGRSIFGHRFVILILIVVVIVVALLLEGGKS